jgi:hypothetical protein
MTVFYRLQIVFLGIAFLTCASRIGAQELEQLYKDSSNSKNAQKSEEEEKKKKYLAFFDAARKNGVTWKCKNYFIFYDSYVFIGNKPDGSDIGKPPFDFVGISGSYKEFIKFSFPALPYENQFELNTKTNELIIFKKTLNKLEKESCQKLSK